MTPAIRLLDVEKVAYRLHPYEHADDADSFGLEAAEKIGVPFERVYKTLVAQADGKLLMALIPVDKRLDLKKLASAVGSKKADLADPVAAQRATGYVLGGISPLGGKKKLPTWIHEYVLLEEQVLVSAGQRGLQVELAVADLVRLTSAQTADLT